MVDDILESTHYGNGRRLYEVVFSSLGHKALVAGTVSKRYENHHVKGHQGVFMDLQGNLKSHVRKDLGYPFGQ